MDAFLLALEGHGFLPWKRKPLLREGFHYRSIYADEYMTSVEILIDPQVHLSEKAIKNLARGVRELIPLSQGTYQNYVIGVHKVNGIVQMVRSVQPVHFVLNQIREGCCAGN